MALIDLSSGARVIGSAACRRSSEVRRQQDHPNVILLCFLSIWARYATVVFTLLPGGDLTHARARIDTPFRSCRAGLASSS
jgi:hypothetical protein